MLILFTNEEGYFVDYKIIYFILPKLMYKFVCKASFVNKELYVVHYVIYSVALRTPCLGGGCSS